MNLKCPKCNQALPKVKTLKYRFCPHCGAEVAAEPEKLDEAYLTIPPDLPLPKADRKPDNANAKTDKKLTETGSLDDQTIAPQPITPQNRPPIKPPVQPPPATFFRTPAAEPEVRPPKSKKQPATEFDPPPPQPPKKPQTISRSKVMIAVLIILALVILTLGGLFTF